MTVLQFLRAQSLRIGLKMEILQFLRVQPLRIGLKMKVLQFHRIQPLRIQGDFESCADILITSCWFHVELGKNI
jgi:hypothetical protein